MTLRTLNYGNYGIFLIVGNAGFCPSTVPSLAICQQPASILVYELLEGLGLVSPPARTSPICETCAFTLSDMS